MRIDAKTGSHDLCDADTRLRPRRGMIDAQDRIWFAEFAGDRIGMFDTKTTKFRESLPDAWT